MLKPPSSPLIVIVGQTASGKSALAMELAIKFDGEIICADSRTVYRGMDIGTAKPSKEDQASVSHHLLDIRDPSERFTAADFKKLANQAIDDITARVKLPIMVGGTGLYVDAVLYDFDFAGAHSPRDELNPRHAAADVPAMRQPLRENTLILGITLDKAVLLERITKRVDHMLSKGILEEVKELINRYKINISAFQTPGYQPFIEYLSGALSLEEAKALFIKNDMNLAKRQLTWFKRNKSIHWIKKQSDAVDIATTFLNKNKQ